MSIQEISISNNQKKQLLRNSALESVLFQDDNGDLVINIAAYQSLLKTLDDSPIETVLENFTFDNNAEYLVLS